ncbi:MAG TPA: hypothetical protein VHA77_00875 [Xanthobacteraceae bacterium]|jgi:hypothetical protein|nr:hypothetical protein [Xanthobacteraceae bacterium]
MISLLGILALALSGWGMARTLRTNAFVARSNRHIRRAHHPVMFWMNFGGMLLLGIIGVALAWIGFTSP